MHGWPVTFARANISLIAGGVKFFSMTRRRSQSPREKERDLLTPREISISRGRRRGTS
jgi:hypothetical protein